jgi:phosphatidate phosphatase
MTIKFSFISVSGIFFIVFFLVDPYARGFYCNDESIRFPLKDDTVPLWLAGAYGAGAAFLIVIMAELFINRQCCADGGEAEFKIRQKRWILNTLNGCLLYSLGAMCTLLITEIGKRSIGRLRPHFIEVCKPNWAIIDCFEKIDDVNVAK